MNYCTRKKIIVHDYFKSHNEGEMFTRTETSRFAHGQNIEVNF